MTIIHKGYESSRKHERKNFISPHNPLQVKKALNASQSAENLSKDYSQDFIKEKSAL
jgi:hypothetical protein